MTPPTPVGHRTGGIYALRTAHTVYRAPALVLSTDVWWWAHRPNSQPTPERWPLRIKDRMPPPCLYDKTGIPVVRPRQNDITIVHAFQHMQTLAVMALPHLMGPGAPAALDRWEADLDDRYTVDLVRPAWLTSWLDYEKHAVTAWPHDPNRRLYEKHMTIEQRRISLSVIDSHRIRTAAAAARARRNA
jgi:hypothetical protein